MTRLLDRSMIAVATFAGAPAAAQSGQTPPDLTDLVGARAAGAETQMQSRGYSNVRASRTEGASWTFWWNGQTCVSIATRDGRYASINGVPNANCALQDMSNGGRQRGPVQGSRPDDRAGPPPGEGGGYGDNGDDSLTLICFGGGSKLATDYRSGYRYNYSSHKYEPYSETGLDRQSYQSDVQIEIWHGRGRIHLGGNMVPPIRSGGDNGWWDLTDLAIQPDRITGRYRLNGLNRPTMTIDRRSGAIAIKGMQPFNGRCEIGNWRGGGGKF